MVVPRSWRVDSRLACRMGGGVVSLGRPGPTLNELLERYREVCDRVAAAAVRSGRTAGDVTLVAAVKGRGAAEVATLLDAGLTALGHNYVQEAEAMRAAVSQPAVWRLIGPLQTNKAGVALRLFDTVDTLASESLARALEQRCVREGREALPVLVQVRLGGEATKSGVDPDQVEPLLVRLQQTPHLLCQGLMTMPPPGPAEAGRRWFVALRQLAVGLRGQTGLALPVLSMGMSEDYEVAIEEGATLVRVGTALFGPRSGRVG